MEKCLVCGKAGLADSAKTCPQCGADLECFKLLDALHEETVIGEVSKEITDLKEQTKTVISSLKTIHETSNTAKIKSWLLPQWLLLSVLIILIAWLVYRDWMVTQRFDQQIKQVALEIETITATQQQMRTDINSSWVEQTAERTDSNRLITLLDQRLDNIKKILTISLAQQERSSTDLEAIEDALSVLIEPTIAATEPQLPSDSVSLKFTQKITDSSDDKAFYYYQPQGHETLWSIANHQYGNGIFFPLLLEYNPGLGIYYDSNFQSLKILKDRKKASKQLRALIVKTAAGKLFRYRVTAGDSWSVLSKRFYGNSTQANILIALNKNAPLTVNTRILIPLPK